MPTLDERDRPVALENEMTPEMVKAGASILLERRSLDYETAEDVVVAIFMAMRSHQVLCKRHRH